MDIEESTEVLKYLRNFYPNGRSIELTKSDLSFSEDAFESSLQYLEEQGYVERLKQDKLRVTPSGIDFIEERERKSTQNYHNWLLAVATAALVFASLMGSYNSYLSNNSRVFYTEGSLDCPEDVYGNFDPSLSNNGDWPADIEWQITSSEGLIVEEGGNDSLSLSPDAEGYNLRYDFRLNESSDANRTSFEFSLTYPHHLLPIVTDSLSKRCEYIETEDSISYDREFKLAN